MRASSRDEAATWGKDGQGKTESALAHIHRHQKINQLPEGIKNQAAYCGDRVAAKLAEQFVHRSCSWHPNFKGEWQTNLTLTSIPDN